MQIPECTTREKPRRLCCDETAARPDRSGQERRAELPEDVLEQLQDDRNEIVQDIVDSVFELLEVEVDNDNAGDILRVLGPSFGPKPRGGQRD